MSNGLCLCKMHKKNTGLVSCLMDSYGKGLDKTVKASYTHLYGMGSMKMFRIYSIYLIKCYT